MIESLGPAGTDREHVLCPTCERAVIAQIAGGIVTVDGEKSEERRVRLVACPDCDQAILIEQVERSGGWSTPIQIFPNGRELVSVAVPSELRREYQEAMSCYEAKAYTATAVMVRRTLEGVCQERGVSGDRRQTLVQSIQKLKENGLIDERLFEWAQALRILGNEGAHYTGNVVVKEDALDALDLAQALLEYLYVLSAKFQAFSERRGSGGRR